MSRSRRARAMSNWPALARLLVAGCAALALVVGGFVQSASVRAQDASPTAAACDAPELPPGTPTPQMEGSPEAEVPGEGLEEEAQAPEASPVAGTPADEATTAAATAAVENIINCLASNPQGAVALFTESFLMEEFGTGNPYDVVGYLEGFVPVLVSVSDVEVLPDGEITAQVDYTQSYQYTSERWHLVQDGEYWKIDSYDDLAPEPAGDTAVVGVALGSADNEYSIVPNATSVTETPVLIFHATNGGQEAHQLVVLKLPEGVTVEQALQDEALQAQVEDIGGIDGIAPGESKDLALVNLPAGEYTLICFYPAPDGQPHAAHGMFTTFTVNAPAA